MDRPKVQRVYKRKKARRIMQQPNGTIVRLMPSDSGSPLLKRRRGGGGDLRRSPRPAVMAATEASSSPTHGANSNSDDDSEGEAELEGLSAVELIARAKQGRRRSPRKHASTAAAEAASRVMQPPAPKVHLLPSHPPRRLRHLSCLC